jgi:F-type H+-transporting ATPase subunit delta
MPHDPTRSTPLSVAYARSLLELANEQNHQAEVIGQELHQLLEVLDADPHFELFLGSPAIGEVERAQVIDHTFRGRVSPLLANFLGVVNQKGRLGLLRSIVNAYDDLLDQQLGKVEVDVTVAQKLTAEQLEQVRQRVGAALKRDAVVHQYIDPAIIGGLVLRVGDRLLDASVRYQLRAIRHQLLAARPK